MKAFSSVTNLFKNTVKILHVLGLFRGHRDICGFVAEDLNCLLPCLLLYILEIKVRLHTVYNSPDLHTGCLAK